MLARVHNPQRFGVVEVHDGQVTRVDEKPSHPTSDLAVVGICYHAPAISEDIHAIESSVRDELEISDAHQYLIDHDYGVGFFEATGW